MSVMKLVKDSTEIAFCSDLGYKNPDIYVRVFHRLGNGNLKTHLFWKKKRWEVPLTFFPIDDAETINGWFDNAFDLTYYPDLINTPSTNYTVKLTNTSKPFAEYSGVKWREYARGTLIIEEV